MLMSIPSKLDCVIPYKKTDSEELRYCLRSLKNIEHDKVFICGDKPDFISDKVIYLARNQVGVTAQHDSELNLRLALSDDRLSEDFILFNDDFFALKKTELENYDNGPIQDVIKRRTNKMFHKHNSYLKNTEQYLIKNGYRDIKSFELHVPMVMNKEKRYTISEDIINILKKGRVVLPRTIYGNLFCDTSKTIDDVKIYDKIARIPANEFLSTLKLENAPSLVKKFNKKCKYEV